MSAIHPIAVAAAAAEVPASYNKSRNVLYVAVITCSRVIQPMATLNSH